MGKPYYRVERLDPMTSIGYLVKRCGVLMAQLAEQRFRGQPVTFTQWLVLFRLRALQQASATRLSEELCHDMGALTRLVDALAGAGLVRRERSRLDRRAVEISITEEGRRQAERCMPAMVDLLNELVAPCSRDEVEALIAQLQRMLLRLQQLTEDAAPPDAGQRRRGPGRRLRSRPAASLPAAPEP